MPVNDRTCNHSPCETLDQVRAPLSRNTGVRERWQRRASGWSALGPNPGLTWGILPHRPCGGDRSSNKGAHVKKTLAAIALVAVALTGNAVLADPPQTLKVVKSVNIDAPVDKVWDALKDFDSLQKWHPGFSSDELVKGENNKPGAQRKLTVKDG